MSHGPRNPRARSVLGPLMLEALGAAGAMITDEFLWPGWDPPQVTREPMADPGLAPMSMPEPMPRWNRVRG